MEPLLYYTPEKISLVSKNAKTLRTKHFSSDETSNKEKTHYPISRKFQEFLPLDTNTETFSTRASNSAQLALIQTKARNHHGFSRLIHEAYSHKKMMKLLDKYWKKEAKEPILPNLIKSINTICVEYIFKEMKRKKIGEFEDLYKHATKKHKDLIIKVKNSEKIISGVLQKLNFFHQQIECWILEGKIKDNYINSAIKNLSIISNTHNSSSKKSKLEVFFFHINKLQKSEDQKKYALIRKAFGDSEEEIMEVLSTLDMWCNQKKELSLVLDKLIRKACGENILNRTIPFAKHNYKLSSAHRKHLNEAVFSEVYRCINFDGNINFKEIKINGQVFYQENSEEKGHCPTSAQENMDIFWRYLLKFIYAKLKETDSPDDTSHTKPGILDQISYIYKNKNNSFNPSDIDAKLPCHRIFKGMTNSAWGGGHKRFNELFEGFTKTPYSPRVNQGIKCSIHIDSNEKFKVTQTKTFILYPKLNLDDPKSWSIDKKRALAEIPVSSTIEIIKDKGKEKWLGSIQVLEEGFKILPGSTEEEKQFILNTLTNLTFINMRLSDKTASKSI